jgi:hypothetical protein
MISVNKDVICTLILLSQPFAFGLPIVAQRLHGRGNAKTLGISIAAACGERDWTLNRNGPVWNFQGRIMVKMSNLALLLAAMVLLCFPAATMAQSRPASAVGPPKSSTTEPADTSAAQTQTALRPAPPIVLGPPVAIDVPLKDGAKSGMRYLGQPANDGKIDLTATNGFFDRCFQAMDPQKVLPGDAGFINASFGYLGKLSDEPGTARWHLWCTEPGEIKATFFMQVPAGEANHPWVIKAGDETQTLAVKASDGQSPQEQTLTFAVRAPGNVTFAIDCTKNPPGAETRIYYVHLEGSAVNKASLLRTRWRPAAVHTHFYAPEECPAPNMWVFETRDVGTTGSYSPITTPFGYFGTLFDNQGHIRAGAGFNFSMWVAGRGATEAPPIARMPRLIGTDLPGAEFSTFGGEGTGVKFRGAVAYPNGADRTIQALRVDARYGVTTFYGYFYDEQAHHWRLYASAQKPGKRGPVNTTAQTLPEGLRGSGRKNRKAEGGGMRGTGSFCEIPGPPARERSGDLVREIRRRGWFFGSDQKWYRAVMAGDIKATTAPDPEDEDSKTIPAPTEQDMENASNRRAYYMENYATDGWMGMATGGIESFTRSSSRKPVLKNGQPPALPEYLTPQKTAELFELPVDFGPSKASAVSSDRATIDYEIKKTGPNSKATLYYGTVDSLTYPAKDVHNGSAVEIAMSRPQRTWQSATPEQVVTAGSNPFKLSGLTAGTTYYFRLFVTHDQGKSWDYQSGSFKAAGAGTTPGN